MREVSVEFLCRINEKRIDFRAEIMIRIFGTKGEGVVRQRRPAEIGLQHQVAERRAVLHTLVELGAVVFIIICILHRLLETVAVAGIRELRIAEESGIESMLPIHGREEVAPIHVETKLRAVIVLRVTLNIKHIGIYRIIPHIERAGKLIVVVSKRMGNLGVDIIEIRTSVHHGDIRNSSRSQGHDG